MSPCVIKLDARYLYSELPVEVVHDLLSDVITRYEGFFTFGQPLYPDGMPELLLKVLMEGYGFAACSEPLNIAVIDLRAVRVGVKQQIDPQWNDVFAGRILAQTFASTLSAHRN
jgi:hypothetical protein